MKSPAREPESSIGRERLGHHKSIDFDRVARYYDLHVSTDLDRDFWIEQCRRHSGPHIELMCGTGRLSLPILRAGLDLCCVDYCAELLARLRNKLASDPLLEARAEVVHADLRELELPRRFGFAFIGFHAISELSEPTDLRRGLERCAALLRPGGVLMLSLHEPRVRGPECDGRWHDLGEYEIPGGTGATVGIRGRWLLESRESGLVAGEQVYIERDPEGNERHRVELPVRFRLWQPEEVEEVAGSLGLETSERFGSYDLPPLPVRSDTRFRITSFRRSGEA